MRIASITGAVALLVALLAGCSAPQDLAVRREGSNLVFAVCERASGDTIIVSTAPKGEGQPEDVWVAEGATLHVDDPLLVVYGVPPVEFSSTTQPRTLTLEGSYVQFYFAATDDQGNMVSSVFGAWDADRISSDSWLTYSGSTRPTPCLG